MSVDPLRVLLRGCKQPKSQASLHLSNHSSGGTNGGSLPDAVISQTNPSRLAPELDFFGSGDTIISEDAIANRPADKPIVSKNDDATGRPATAERTPPESQIDVTMRALVQHPRLRTALSRMQISFPTAVQRRAIPLMLSGHDVVAVAPTGSGKTLAYALPLLTRILADKSSSPHSHGPQVLILAPTRELAHQISRVFSRLSQEGSFKLIQLLLTSRSALASLSSAPKTIHVTIATPQTVISALESANFSLKAVRHVILDEADELLQEKFVGQVDTILAAANAHRENGTRVHLFSATLPGTIDDLARSLLNNMKKVVIDGGSYGGVAAVNELSRSITQIFKFVGGREEQGKVMAVRDLLKRGLKPPVLVFVQSKERAAELFRELIYDGVQVDSIHGDRTAAARTSAVARFRAGKIWVLIATDILARGLDFLSVQTVINYDMPTSATAYVHRIGRTGRNGRSGSAITLFTEEDNLHVGPIVKVARASGAEVPDWLVNLSNKVRRDELKRLVTRPPKRRRVGGPNRASLRKGPRKKRRKSGEDEQDDEASNDGDEDAKDFGLVGESASAGSNPDSAGKSDQR